MWINCMLLVEKHREYFNLKCLFNTSVLIEAKFVSAMIYQSTWKRNMKSRLAIKFPTPYE